MSIAGAEPYYWLGSSTGILLLHGFTGSPAELKELGRLLHTEGYTVAAPLLPGHGTDPHELDKVTWQEWKQSVQTAYEQLQQHCSHIVVIGMSMGSLLALELASREKLSGLVLMGTPIFLYDWRLPFLRWCRPFMRAVKKKPRVVAAPEEYNVCYHELPLFGVQQLCYLLAEVKHKVLHMVQCPCLLIQSTTERTVKPESVNYLYEQLASTDKSLLLLPGARHVVTLDEQRFKVYSAVQDFLKHILEQ